MPPVVYRVIFQLAAALELSEFHLADLRKSFPNYPLSQNRLQGVSESNMDGACAPLPDAPNSKKLLLPYARHITAIVTHHPRYAGEGERTPRYTAVRSALGKEKHFSHFEYEIPIPAKTP